MKPPAPSCAMRLLVQHSDSLRFGFLDLLSKGNEFPLGRIQREGLFDRALSRGPISFFIESPGEQVMGLGVVLFLFQRTEEVSFRIAPAFFGKGDDAEIIVRALVIWIEMQRGKVIRFGRFFVAAREPNIAQRKIRLRVLRNVGVREIELRLGEGEVVCLERLPTGIVAVERPERWIVLGNGYKPSGRGEKKQKSR